MMIKLTCFWKYDYQSFVVMVHDALTADDKVYGDNKLVMMAYSGQDLMDTIEALFKLL